MVPFGRMVAGLALAVVSVACGAADRVVVGSSAGGSTGEVLSPCEPVEGQQTSTLVDASGERPPIDVMEEAIAGHPDHAFVIEQRQRDGAAYEDALHEMYAQVVGGQLFADAQQLPGFVTSTGRIEVIDATPDQVTAWEEAVDDPSRWCLVRAPRTPALTPTPARVGGPHATSERRRGVATDQARAASS